MQDRQPVNALVNGAIRYGVYNSDGTLNRYEYIKLEDGATVLGTALNKANLLNDATANKIASNIGVSTPVTPSDALNALAYVPTKFVMGSYVGTGAGGAVIPLQFRARRISFYESNNRFGMLLFGATGANSVYGYRYSPSSFAGFSGTVSGNTVTEGGEYNQSGMTYYYIAEA